MHSENEPWIHYSICAVFTSRLPVWYSPEHGVNTTCTFFRLAEHNLGIVHMHTYSTDQIQSEHVLIPFSAPVFLALPFLVL